MVVKAQACDDECWAGVGWVLGWLVWVELS